MKKMMLIISMLVIFQGVDCMDRHELLARESGLDIQTDGSGLLLVIPDTLRVFGMSGNKIEPNSVAIKFRPKATDTASNDLLQRARRTKQEVEFLYVNCRSNTIQFGPNAQINESRGAFHIDLTAAITSIPHHVKYKDGYNQIKEISAAAYVANLLYHITVEDYDSAKKQLGILQGGKGAKLMKSLRPVIEQEQYDAIVKMDVQWADGVTKTLSTLMVEAQKQAEKFAQKMQKEAQKLADGAKKEGEKAIKSFWSKLMKDKSHGLTCMTIGGSFMFLIMYFWRK